MKKNRLFILLILTVFIVACTDKNSPTNQTGGALETIDKTSGSPTKVTYLRMKAEFSRRADKGFAIVTLDLKTGKEKEYKNNAYKNVEIIGHPNPHPSGKKVITYIRKYDGAPRKIVEIELESGEVRELPNISPQSLLPRYSPEGDRIAYHDPMNEDNQHRIVIYNIAQEKGEHLPCNGSKCSQPDWYPDGTKIVFVEDRKKLIEYDLSSNTQSSRYALKESQSGIKIVNPRYSPDGEKILFLEYKKKNVSVSNYREQDINKLLSLDKNNKTTVIYEKKGIAGVEWCPDSQHIIFTAFDYSDRKNLSEMNFLKLGEKTSTILKSFDQENIKFTAYCR